MNTPKPQQSGPEHVWGDSIHLNILVACEDAACGQQARTVIVRMLPLLPMAAEAHTTTLEFAAFNLQAALEQVERPDIIIVAAHGRNPLPPTVKDWLERWAAGAHSLTCAMTAVIDRQHQLAPAAVEMVNYLKGLAQRTQVDWLEAGRVPLPEEAQFRQHLTNQANTVSSTLTEIIRTQHPRTWA